MSPKGSWTCLRKMSPLKINIFELHYVCCCFWIVQIYWSTLLFLDRCKKFFERPVIETDEHLESQYIGWYLQHPFLLLVIIYNHLPWFHEDSWSWRKAVEPGIGMFCNKSWLSQDLCQGAHGYDITVTKAVQS